MMVYSDDDDAFICCKVLYKRLDWTLYIDNEKNIRKVPV